MRKRHRPSIVPLPMLFVLPGMDGAQRGPIIDESPQPYEELHRGVAPTAGRDNNDASRKRFR